jgi:hypothetical protein
MTATLLYRIAAVLLILFAAAHTFGSLNFTPPTPEAAAVRDAMNSVHFTVKGNTYSYGNFYKGLILSVTAYLVFLAFLSWHLGSVAAKQPQAIGALGWLFCALKLATMVVAWLYIAAAPAISSAVVGVCLGLAAWRVQNAAARSGHAQVAAG